MRNAHLIGRLFERFEIGVVDSGGDFDLFVQGVFGFVRGELDSARAQ